MKVCYPAYRDQELTAYREANCNARGLNNPDNYYNDALIVYSGNENLTAERAYTFSGGFVFSPQLVENLNLTVDYWDIHLVDKIGTLSWSSVYPNCMDSATLDNIFCQMIEYKADYTQINVAYLQSGQTSDPGRRLCAGLPVRFSWDWHAPGHAQQLEPFIAA